MRAKKKLIATLVLLVAISNNCDAREITIIRHGEADHNVHHFYSSNPEHPKYRASFLTNNGQKQAIYTAHKLQISGLGTSNIAVVFVSPLPRTKQTANLLAGEKLFSADKIKIHAGLIEMQMGNLEGESSQATGQSNWDHPENKFHFGEDEQQLTCRMQSFYNEVIQQYPKGDILIVTHGSPSMKLIKLLTNKTFKLKTADAITLKMPQGKLNRVTC